MTLMKAMMQQCPTDTVIFHLQCHIDNIDSKINMQQRNLNDSPRIVE